MDLETSAFMKIHVYGIGNPIAVDVDPMNGHVYWTDRTTKRIRRVDVDGRNDITIRQLGGRKYYMNEFIMLLMLERVLCFSSRSNGIFRVLF